MLLDFIQQELSRGLLGSDLFGVSVLGTCPIIHKISRAIAKRKEHFLSFPKNLADTKKEFYKKVSCNKLFWGEGGGGRAGLGYKSTVFLTILLFRDFCFFPVSNFDISKRFSSTSFNCFMTLQIVFFLGLEFQPPPASLDLVRFQFDSVWVLKVDFFVILLFFFQRFIVVSFIFYYW